MKGLGSIVAECLPLLVIPPTTGHLGLSLGSNTPSGFLALRLALSKLSNLGIADEGS